MCEAPPRQTENKTRAHQSLSPGPFWESPLSKAHVAMSSLQIKLALVLEFVTHWLLQALCHLRCLSALDLALAVFAFAFFIGI